MSKHTVGRAGVAVFILAFAAGAVFGQPPVNPGEEGGPRFVPFGRSPGGVGGGPMGQERKLVEKFDTDRDGRLNITERAAAREMLKQEKVKRPNRMGRGGGGPMGGGEEEGKPGPAVLPSDVQPVAGDLYDPSVLRTIFLDFDTSGWEAELEDFYNTDVEVPATLTVDGKQYPGVGVHFRGASSFFGVRSGSKRSLNVSLDFTDQKQVLRTGQKDGASKPGSDGGYRTLNLLNSHEDPSFMSSVLYSTIANQYLPAPRANYVRVVVNGESWGVYVNVEQFNKDFVRRNFPAAGGKKAKGEGHEARWKVKGSPGSRSGLEYTGDAVGPYRQKFQIKSDDNEADWNELINLCKVLNTTPPEKLESALAPILDVDAALKFLALDVVLANSDGYWARASDYSLYKDAGGQFHIVPHDMNEAFRSSLMMPGGGRPQGGPAGDGRAAPAPRRGGGEPPDAEGPPDAAMEEPPQPEQSDRHGRPVQRRGPRGGGMGGQSGTELDPLVGLDDASKPLRSKLLAVPALRERYLGYVKEIAEKNLDWGALGQVVAANRQLIEKEIEADTRKLTSLDAFRRATADEPVAVSGDGQYGRERVSLRSFADKRRAYLLGYTPKVPATVEASKGSDR